MKSPRNYKNIQKICAAFSPFLLFTRRSFGRDSRGTNLLDALWQLYISNADNTAGWETRTARATTSSKQAAYPSLPCKHESSITTLLLLSPQSRPALRGPQDGRAGNAPWAALAGCIMPPNLLGHTMSGLHIRQAAVAGVASSQDPFHEL